MTPSLPTPRESAAHVLDYRHRRASLHARATAFPVPIGRPSSTSHAASHRAAVARLIITALVVAAVVAGFVGVR